MGDIIEFTQERNTKSVFYKVTSSALVFEVKSSSGVSIALSNKPCNKMRAMIHIGEDRRCWMSINERSRKSVIAPNILSGDEFRKFWISWYGGFIRLGREDEKKPLIEHVFKNPKLKYVRFLIGHTATHWRVELPPERPTIPLKSIKEGTPTWLTTEYLLPETAVIGGFEKEKLYIIRAKHHGSLTPGKFVPSQGVGFISWGGESHEKDTIEVLTGYNMIWMPGYKNVIPRGAIVGGHAEATNETLYVGRAMHEGYLIPGKVQLSHCCCYIPYDGKEICKKQYEVLIDPEFERRGIESSNEEVDSDVQEFEESDEEEYNESWDNESNE